MFRYYLIAVEIGLINDMHSWLIVNGYIDWLKVTFCSFLHLFSHFSFTFSIIIREIQGYDLAMA